MKESQMRLIKRKVTNRTLKEKHPLRFCPQSWQTEEPEVRRWQGWRAELGTTYGTKREESKDDYSVNRGRTRGMMARNTYADICNNKWRVKKEPKGLATGQRGNRIRSRPEMSERRRVTGKRNELQRHGHPHSDEMQRRKPQWLRDKEWKNVAQYIQYYQYEI